MRLILAVNGQPATLRLFAGVRSARVVDIEAPVLDRVDVSDASSRDMCSIDGLYVFSGQIGQCRSSNVVKDVQGSVCLGDHAGAAL